MFKEIKRLSDIKEGSIVEIVEIYDGYPCSVFRGVATEKSYTLGWSTDINFPLVELSEGRYLISLSVNLEYNLGIYFNSDGTVDKNKLKKEDTGIAHVSMGLVGTSDFTNGNKVYLLGSIKDTSEYVKEIVVNEIS